MKQNIKGYVFIVFIFSFFILTFITPDQLFSNEEKRNLTQFTLPTVESIFDGEWTEEFEEYATDQFPLRNEFRTSHALFRLDILNQKDISGLYTINDYIFKMDYPIRYDNIERFAQKTNDVYTQLLQGNINNYYVSVIPDKNYYSDSSYLNTNAKEVADLFSSQVIDAKYIDIFDRLNLESFYKTDTHWSQDQLFNVMDIFAKEMDFTPLTLSEYTPYTIENFNGVLQGQFALNMPADSLVYLESNYTNHAIVNNFEDPDFKEVYDLEKFDSEDSYNLFLSGATGLTTITSPYAKTDKELIIFRDSYGSSIAPLFLESYKTVTLIDMRYFSSSLLDQYVDFTNKDVLVLYSTLILNSNIILR